MMFFASLKMMLLVSLAMMRCLPLCARRHTSLGVAVIIGTANIICRRQTSFKKRTFVLVDKSAFFVGRGRRIPYSASLRSKFVLRSTTAFCRAKTPNIAPVHRFAVSGSLDQSLCQTEKPTAYGDGLLLFGRGRRIRTRDPRFWRPVLYQLSYTPVYGFFRNICYYITFLF